MKSLDKTLTITLQTHDVSIIIRALTQRLIPWAKKYCKKIDSPYNKSEYYHMFLKDFKSEINTLYKLHRWENDTHIKDFQNTIFNMFSRYEVKNEKTI